MKIIQFTSKSTPEKPEFGYGDQVQVLDGGNVLHDSAASCCPNPYKLNGQGHPIPWRLVYAMMAPGNFRGECVQHPTFGKCILLNEGGQVTTVNPNKNHGGEYYATEVFIHPGGLNSKNPNWRGSRCCLTIPQSEIEHFRSCFAIGEKCAVQIFKPDQAVK